MAIDPGHGMGNKKLNVFDLGATHIEDGCLYEEAKIPLHYGLVLKNILFARRHSVFMTCVDNEDYASYWERAENAKKAGCDIF